MATCCIQNKIVIVLVLITLIGIGLVDSHISRVNPKNKKNDNVNNVVEIKKEVSSVTYTSLCWSNTNDLTNALYWKIEDVRSDVEERVLELGFVTPANNAHYNVEFEPTALIFAPVCENQKDYYDDEENNDDSDKEENILLSNCLYNETPNFIKKKAVEISELYDEEINYCVKYIMKTNVEEGKKGLEPFTPSALIYSDVYTFTNVCPGDIYIMTMDGRIINEYTNMKLVSYKHCSSYSQKHFYYFGISAGWKEGFYPGYLLFGYTLFDIHSWEGFSFFPMIFTLVTTFILSMLILLVISEKTMILLRIGNHNNELSNSLETTDVELDVYEERDSDSDDSDSDSDSSDSDSDSSDSDSDDNNSDVDDNNSDDGSDVDDSEDNNNQNENNNDKEKQLQEEKKDDNNDNGEIPINDDDNDNGDNQEIPINDNDNNSNDGEETPINDDVNQHIINNNDNDEGEFNHVAIENNNIHYFRRRDNNNNNNRGRILRTRVSRIQELREQRRANENKYTFQDIIIWILKLYPEDYAHYLLIFAASILYSTTALQILMTIRELVILESVPFSVIIPVSFGAIQLIAAILCSLIAFKNILIHYYSNYSQIEKINILFKCCFFRSRVFLITVLLICALMVTVSFGGLLIAQIVIVISCFFLIPYQYFFSIIKSLIEKLTPNSYHRLSS